ncbi:MAG TPA: glycosyltransferase family 2 protein [Acidimicrobiales bacterium]|nr:glycosyltransferase family 2 protein [Acidimicrobiales bacterium]
MAPSSSVVVVSHRPGSWLAECLASAMLQASEVVVVDNGSTGAEASEIARGAGATVVRASRNLGFAGGVNLGLRRAGGEIVALLNDDAVAGPAWLDTACAVLADPTVAAVTPKVVLDGLFAEVVLEDDPWFAPGDHRPLGRQLRSVTVGGDEVLGELLGAGVYDCERATVDGRPDIWRWTSGREPFYLRLPDPSLSDTVRVNGEPVEVRSLCTLVNHAGNFLERHGIAGDYGFGAPDDGRFDQAAERFGFSGTAPVFRSETLAKVGGLAGPFFAYNEDTDWCLRARLAGLRIVYDPGATVRHRLSATSGGAVEPFVQFLAQRNALLCLVRNAPADVAGRFVWSRIREGSGSGVRRAMLRRLPWAVATRMRMRHLRVEDPRRVWDRWAGVDTTWDTRPAHSPPSPATDPGCRGGIGS